ncbi:hypothetical protein SDJN03_28284, partial [Cucurbita argyrosperma subsp. sororia]
MEMTCSREGTEGSLKEAGLEKRVRTKYGLNDDVEESGRACGDCSKERVEGRGGGCREISFHDYIESTLEYNCLG